MQAQNFTVLYNFSGPPNGEYPYAGVVRDEAGNLYGTTSQGGTGNCYQGCGLVFKIDQAGKETVLHSFTGGSDGGYPYPGLIQDSAGNLYGTTFSGGSTDSGIVFKLTRHGKETVLHNFIGPEGCQPMAGLLRDSDGNFYGTTNACGAYTWGTVFKMSKTGEVTALHSFSGPDGASPYWSSVVMDEEGNLYGTTNQGGPYNWGAVFKLSKSGKITVLHTFAGGTQDGCYPTGTPTLDSHGSLYGTASCGADNVGVIWRVGSKGKETIVHNFAGGSSDGENPGPDASMIRDSEGNLYGLTTGGGTSNNGVVYTLNTKGEVTVLYSFPASGGQGYFGDLLREPNGTLYGTTNAGGSNEYGTVWKLTP